MLADLLVHYPSLALTLTVAIVLVTGVFAQVLAIRLAVPAILLLLGSGIVLGPAGIGLIHPEIFGDGLRAIVSIAVAIIVFEGAMLIDARQLRHSSRSVIGLITIGAAITFVLAGLLTHWIMGMPLKVAMLFGAIVSVTGPTVIGPILKRLPLTHRLKTVLEAESVLVDAVGVLLTAAVFSYITKSNLGVAGGMTQLVTNLLLGAAIGAFTAFGLKAALSRSVIIPTTIVRVMVLGAVLLGYSLAEVFAHESGIAAVAVAGLMVGSMRLPYEEAVKQFKTDLTVMSLSMVFILLAASMRLEQLVALGWQGVLVVFLLMFVIRPIAVTAATWGTDLSWRERTFIAWMGPRGIVAASLATLMTLELKAWDIQGGELLGALVFLTVILTVLIEGSGAGWMAHRLRIMPKKIIIIGGDEIARKLALQLMEEEKFVSMIDSDPGNVRVALDAGIAAIQGDATDAGVLDRAGAGWCEALVTATQSDKSNLMVSQVARSKFPDVRLVARVNDPKNADTFKEAGIETLTTADAAAMALSTLVTRPTVLPLLRASAYGDMIAEVTVGNTRVDRQTIAELQLPQQCLVALLKREGKVSVPNGKTPLAVGDIVTLIGLKAAVEQTRTILESDV